MSGMLWAVAMLALVPVSAAAQASTDSASPDLLVCQVPFVTADSLRVDSVGGTTLPGSRGAAIILRASASAREVRFASQPRITVRLCGGSVDSVRVLDRRNLPDPVQPGVTYRDVFVAVEIIGHLHAQCVADRLAGARRGSAGLCVSPELRDSSAGGRPPR